MADWIDEVKPDTSKLPYSDQSMEWNADKERYILTEYGVMNETGIDMRKQINEALGDAANIIRFYLDNISLKIYQYIYSFAYNVGKIKHVLTYSPTARKMLYDAMIQQAVYFVTNGDVSQFAGVNMRTGAVVGRKKLIQAAISPMAESIIINSYIPELGTSIVNLSIC